MNSELKKMAVSAINNQWIKGAKNLVMGFANKTFMERMDWLYTCYGKITLIHLMKNQDKMQTSYHVEGPIEILFDQINMGQELLIAVNSPLSDRKHSYIGIAQILATQVYTHAYPMWENVLANKCTWVRFKVHFWEAYLDWE